MSYSNRYEFSAGVTSVILIVVMSMLLLSAQAISARNFALYENEETKQLVRLVDEATDLIEKEGEATFGNFYVKGSKWFEGDKYIFVWGLDGTRYVYPRDPEKEGENMVDLEDVNGKPIGRQFLETAESKTGEGWVFYEWTEPGKTGDVWKSTFIKRAVAPDGKEYLVGSGRYNMPLEKAFIKHTVDGAVDLIEEKGKHAAFSAFNDASSSFFFLDTYIFVKTMEGVELVNPEFRELVGQNIIDLQDENGKYFIRNEIDTLRYEDDCWYSYMWPKPGEDSPSRKVVYVKKAELPAETLIVGAGYFPDSE